MLLLRLVLFLSLVLRCAGSLAEVTSEKAPTVVAAPKNLAELKQLEDRFRQVVAKVLPSTVGVQVGNARGSGVIVSEDGYVMTAGHVVGEPGRDVIFFLADGKKVKGKTLGVFRNADAGVMKITDEGKWPFVEKGHSAQLQPGSWCVAVGHPLGYQEDRPPVIRVGRLLQVRETVLQTDCLLVGGDSGGPLFDLDAKLIGINSRIGGPTNMNFHVPVDVFHTHWERLVRGDAWQLELPGRDDAEVKAAFREVVAAAAGCTVRVKCDGREVALGTIVGPNGWIVTKASELKGKIVCVLPDQRELAAEKIGVHQPYDLAMLKIDAVDLPAITWADSLPEVGQWVAVAGLADDPLAVGAVSVPPREIPPIPGQLGVQLEEGEGGAHIQSIVPNSPAEKAGLKPGDVITHLDGEPAPNRDELVAMIRKRRLGQEVQLTVKRAGKELQIKAILGRLNTPAARKREMQNRLGVGLSKRRDDFPLVLQHDAVVRPTDCGGPVVDLSGQVIGINIAHGGRTETYCAPVDELLPLFYELMSGRLTPPEVQQARQREAEAAKQAEEQRRKAEEEKKAEEQRKKAEAEQQQKQQAQPPEQPPSPQPPPDQPPNPEQPPQQPPDEKPAQPSPGEPSPPPGQPPGEKPAEDGSSEGG